MNSESRIQKRADTQRQDPLADMIFVPGGTFRTGSERHYSEEAPVHRVGVDAFWIDRTPSDERPIPQVRQRHEPRHLRQDRARPEGLSGRTAAHAEGRIAGFTPPKGAVGLRDGSQWWQFKFGAGWRRMGLGPPCGADRHLDEPRRLPLRSQEDRARRVKATGTVTSPAPRPPPARLRSRGLRRRLPPRRPSDPPGLPDRRSASAPRPAACR